MRETEVEVKNRRGETIRGTLTYASAPPSSTSAQTVPLTLAIFCHGFYADRDHFLLTRCANTLLLAEGGNETVVDSTFRFDFSGNGDSDGPFNSYGGYEEERHDLEDVVAFFRDTNARKQAFTIVACIGHSKGAAAPLHYAALHDDIPVIIGLASRFYMMSKVTPREKKLLMEKGRISVKDEVAGNITITLTMTQYRSFTELKNKIVNSKNITRTRALVWIHGDNDKVRS